MSREMARVQIIGLKPALLPVIRALGELGCVHLDRAADAPELLLQPLSVDAALIRAQEEISRHFAQVKGLLDMLGIARRAAPPAGTTVEPLDVIYARIAELVPQVRVLKAQQDALRAERELLARFEDTMRQLLPVFPPMARQPDSVSFGLLVSRSHADVLTLIASEVGRITQGRAETATAAVGEALCAMLIVVPRAYADPVNALLDREDVSRLRLPREFSTDSPDAAIAALRRQLNALPGRLAQVEQDLAALAQRWEDRLLLWSDRLQDELDAYEVVASAGETGMTFVLLGWTPEDEVERVQRALYERAGDAVEIIRLPVTPEERRHAPVLLANPAPVRPFEALVRLYGLPGYDVLDPSRLMALFMPIFFGMMLGDIGYGALLLGLVFLVRRRLKPGMMRSLTTVLAYGAGWAIVFGVLFGEFFGRLGESFGLHAILFDRASEDHLLDLLALSVGVGGMHLVLGLFLGLWEGARQRSRHHLLERGGRLLGLIALFLLVGALVEVLPDGLITPAVALLVIGTVLLGASLGRIGVLMAPIEMIGLVGNVLSYLRIAAIGLSSVYLALVAGEIAGTVGSVVVGVIIAALLHALNLVLGAFSPTIQSLRLHYVEFFRNFYEGGGRPYQPLAFRLPHVHEQGKEAS